jgi:hypothetical protein
MSSAQAASSKVWGTLLSRPGGTLKRQNNGHASSRYNPLPTETSYFRPYPETSSPWTSEAFQEKAIENPSGIA